MRTTAQKPRVTIPKKFEFLFFPKRYKVARSGRGAGKSWSFARALLIIGARRPIRVLCTREYQSSIRDSVHRLLTDQIEQLGLSRFYYAGKTEIIGRMGTLFIFEGIKHNVTKIKSMEGIDIVWCEEAERMTEESWRVLIPTIRKMGSEIWVSYNPDQEEDPTHKRFTVNPPKDSIIVHATWRDNKWFPEELKREMEYDYEVDPDTAAWIWEGECRRITDAQVLNGKWTIREFTPRVGWNGPYFGADWGFSSDPTVLVRFWIGGNRLWVEHEAYGANKIDLDDIPQLFDQVPESRGYMIRADSSRPETISHVRKKGFRIIGAEKWKGSVEDGIFFLRSFVEIVIHPRCKNTAKEARLWSYKKDKLTGDPLPQLEDGHDHCWDSIRYGAEPIIRRKNTGIASAGRRTFT